MLFDRSGHRVHIVKKIDNIYFGTLKSVDDPTKGSYGQTHHFYCYIKFFGIFIQIDHKRAKEILDKKCGNRFPYWVPQA